MSDEKKLDQKKIQKNQKRLEKHKKRYVKEMDSKRQSSFTKRLIKAKRIGTIKKTAEKEELIPLSFILYVSVTAFFVCACILMLSVPVGIKDKEAEVILSVILISDVAAGSYIWAKKFCNATIKYPAKLWGTAWAVIFAAVVVKRRDLIRDGFLIFLKHYLECLNQYFGMSLKLVVNPSGKVGVTFFLVLCAVIFVIAIISAKGSRARCLVMFILMCISCGLAMMVGKKPQGIWLLISFVIFIGFVNAQETDRNSVRTGLVMTMLAVSVFLLAGYLTGLKDRYEEEYAIDMRKKLEDKAQDLQHYINENFKLNIKIFGNDSRDNGFSLDNNDNKKNSLFEFDFRRDKDKILSKLKKSGGLAFGNIPEGKINLDYKKERIVIETSSIDKEIYIKGYVADSYKPVKGFGFKGRTQEVHSTQIEVLQEMIRTGRADADTDTVTYLDPEGDRRIITIRNKEKDGMQYIPYFSVGAGRNGEIESDTWYNEDGRVYTEASEFEQKLSAVVDISSPGFDVDVYRKEVNGGGEESYLSDNYLMTDDDVEDDFSFQRYDTDNLTSISPLTDLFREQLNDDRLYYLEDLREERELSNKRTIELARIVSRYLSENMTYTLSPPYNNSGENDIDFFLTSSQKGYCMHYAQSAVLLLAAMNVPVRYVEGYVADRAYLKDNAVYNDSLKMYRVSLHGANAHAWIEVYLYGYGWVPVEVTRSFSQIMNPKKNEPTKKPTVRPAATEPAATTPALKTQAPETVKPTPTPAPENSAAPKNTPTPAPKQDHVSRIDMTKVLKVLTPFLAVMIAVFIIYLIIREQRKRFYRRISTDAGLIKYMLKTLETLAAKRGIVYSNEKTYGEFAEELAGYYEELEIEDILIFLSNVNKQLFSKESLSETEMESCIRLYAEFIRAEYDMRGYIGKLLLLAEKKRVR